ncbi:MAG: M23 family metallopeptidase [Gallionella sp.]
MRKLEISIASQANILLTILLSFITVTATFPHAVLAAPPAFELPIRCNFGQDCFIQSYVDHDRGSGWRDYTCRYLSYNNHIGTDFRLPSMVDLRRRVAVIAAADGIVTGARDGLPDIPIIADKNDPETVKFSAGNAVRIDHGDGWETQYSHMMQGSVSVKPGQKVSAGDKLGIVGLSGNTVFPHLDFAVRYHNRVIDPFAPSGNNNCDLGSDTLWKPETLKVLRYTPTGLLLAGWADEVPNHQKTQNGEYADPDLDAAALVFWVELFGVRKYDRQIFELYTPSGYRIMSNSTVLTEDNSALFSYRGKSRPPHGWPAGTFRAEYRLKRNGVTIVSVTKELTLH